MAKIFRLTLCISFIFCLSTYTIAQTTFYNFTGSDQTYTVPAGVSTITIKMWGAGGGGGENGSDGGVGGGGAYVSGTLCVTPGETFTVVVGGGGGAGGNAASKTNAYGGGGASRDRPWDGGGGGGRTALRRNSTGIEVAIAGAGGGGGSRNNRAGGAGGGVGSNGGKGDNCSSYGRGGNADGTVPGGGNNSAGTAWNGFIGGAGGNAEQLSADNSGGGGGGGFGGGQGGCTGGNDSGGGGGGSSRLDGFTSTGTSSGSGQTAGNAADADNAGLYGRGGNRNAAGQNGRVVISVTPGTTLGAITGSPSACVNGFTQLNNSTAGGTWSSSNNAVATVSGTGLVTGVTVGSATITYTLTTPCGIQSVSQLVNISGPPTVAAITGTSSLCAGGTTQLSNATPGGTWSSSDNGIASVSGSGLVSGVSVGIATISYAVAGTCGTTTVTQQVNVTTTPTLPVITGNPSVCVNATTQLANATAGGTWSSNNNAVATVNASSGLVSGVSAGNAIITYSVTSSCGTATTTQQVTVTGPPAVQPITGVNNVCVNGTTQLSNATGGGVWTSGDNNIATVNGAGTVSGVSQGNVNINYAVTGTCGTTTVSANVTVNSLPIVPSITGSNKVCVGATTQLANALSGGTWSSSNTNIATVDASSGLVSGVASGNATITYTVTQNGCTGANSVQVNINALPVVASTVATNVLCAGGANGGITVGGSGGNPPYTYSIDNGQNFQNSGTFSGLSVGSYNVFISDAAGCSAAFAFNPVVVSEPTAITQNNTVDNSSCANVFDGKITVNSNGGTQPYSYSLNGGAPQPSNIFSGLLSGVYTVQVVDANGCTNASTESIDTAFAVAASIVSQVNVSCFGANDGLAEVQLTGGLQPYSYSINGVQFVSSPVFSGLSAGNYLITLRDSKGCTDFVSINITQPAAVSVSVDSLTNVLCGGDSTGSIVVSATGGTAPYSFAWSNGGKAANINNLKAGSYRVTVSDVNSCSATRDVLITQPLQLFAVVASYQNVQCAGDSSGYVDVSVSGGTPPYTFNWNTGAATEDIIRLADGTYSITVSDFNNCAVEVSQTLTQPLALNVSASVTNATCFGETGDVDVSVSGGVQPYNYVWSNGATTQDIASVSAGAYIVTVTDNNQCSKQLVNVVTQPDEIAVTANISNTSCDGGSIGGIDVTVSGGSGNYTYQWSANAGNATSQDVSNLSAGTYTVTITDAAQCSKVAVFEVKSTSSVLVVDLAEVNPICSEGTNGFITVFVSGGTAPYVYAWNNGQTKNTASNLSQGSYTVTVTDVNGCEASATGEIFEPQPIDISVFTTGSKCKNIGTGFAEVIVTGGTAPFTYQLNGVVQTSNEFGKLLPGSYSVMVRDANGCTAVTSFEVVQTNIYSVQLSAEKILILSGMETQLNAVVISESPVLSYFWSPLGALSYPNCADTLNCSSPVAAPSVTTIYTVTVLNEDSCITSDTVLVSVSNQPSNFFPTAFSPNGDGLNDRFEFDVLGAKSADVRIFNRWGNLVYSNPSQQNGITGTNGWDGTFKGKPLEAETFVYTVVVKYFNDVEQRFTGTVALMR